jgi:5'-deoxynucleotidase YfbR-like HD superfamily hydrolase
MIKTRLGACPDVDFYNGKVGTHSGRLINLYDPDPDDFNIRDIALGLSNLNRFNGQTRPGYNVAQHSVHVARMFEKLDPKLRLGALLHDAHEAYTGDIVRPIKGMPELKMPIREIEDRVTIAIFLRFGIFGDVSLIPFPDEIKVADDLVLAREAVNLMLIGHNEWPQVRNEQALRVKADEMKLGNTDYQIVPLTPSEAEDAFLEEFINTQRKILVTS